jgi:hypothetical protein
VILKKEGDMPKKETVKVLVDAFNVNNCAHGIIKSNIKLQSRKTRTVS